MNPFPTPPPETIILLGWSLPCIALISLGAFAVLSSRHNCKLLELKLNECQITSRLSEKEFAIAIKAMDVQVLALKSKSEELHQRLLGLEKRNEELVCIVAQSDAEFLRRSAEVEKTWSKERDDIQRESDLEILSFKVNFENKRMIAQTLTLASENEEMRRQLSTLEKRKDELVRLITQKEDEHVARRSELEEVWLKERDGIQRANDRKIMAFQDDMQTMKAVCAFKDDQLQTLARAKDELQAIRLQYERRIFELTKQLSAECVAAGGDMGAWFALIQGIDKKELQEICGRQEQKIWEVNDKLSECHRRLSAGSGIGNSAYSTFWSPPQSSSQPDPARRDPRATV